MRLYEYISSKNEVMDRKKDPALDELLTVLERDCKKFIKETGGFLFRGTNRTLGGDIYKKTNPREDRRPVDTPRMVHALADELYFKKFGWKVRSEGLFTATNISMTAGYGSNRYLVFPIGNFEYVWSEDSYDFFITQSNLASDYQRSTGTGKDMKKQFPKEIMQGLVDMYTDKNLKKAWSDRQSREIILHCPNGYYYVNTLSIGELSHYLNIDR